MLVTRFNRDFHWPGQFGNVPDAVRRFKLASQQFFSGAGNDPVADGVEFDHVQRTWLAAKVQAFTLANREIVDPVVVPEYFAAASDDLAPDIGHVRALAQEPAIVVLRHETYFLALLLAIRLKADLFRDGPSLFLRHVAQRKHRAGKLFLVQREQEIRLVLPIIPAFAELVAVSVAVGLLNPRVMPRRNEFRAERARLAQERTEFHFLVADNAWVGRPAPLVFSRKIIHHLALERVDLVDHVIRDVERMRHHPRVHDGLRPATFVFLDGSTVLWPTAEGQTDHVVPFLLQKMGRHARVHAPAHAHAYPLLL